MIYPSRVRSLLFLLILAPCLVFSQPGKDGAETVTGTNIIWNRYTSLASSITSGTNMATVTNIADLNGGAAGANNPYATSTIAYGDLIMVIKMQGASITTTNDASYGAITNLNGVGTYEIAVVSGVSGNTISICNSFANSYSVTANEKVQVIRIPRLNALTTNSGASLTCSPWNGTIGGVLAIEVNGNVVNNGSMVVTGRGFRGGAIDNNTSTAGGAVVTAYVSNNSSTGAEKGEGIAGDQVRYDALGGRYNRGAAANGGGGGNGHNAGGGGGANFGNVASWTGNGNPVAGYATTWNLEGGSFSTSTSTGGGRGGYTYSANNQNAGTVAPGNTTWGGDNRQNVGGKGGRPLAYSSNTLFLGGGGGAGDANNSSGGAGGNGGGIIYILGTGTLSGSGSIQANGSAGVNSNNTLNDAPGGGGGGGAIRLNISGAITGVTVSATGGAGGNQPITSAEAEGPGGGGGGGSISAPSSGSVSNAITGGNNGTTSSSSLTEFPPNGATRGGDGSYRSSEAFVAAPLTTCSGLPVRFISFNLKEEDNLLTVLWTTADEKQVDKYIIEKSIDQQTWEAAGTVPAMNAAGQNDYSKKVVNDNIVYVRIRSVDVDGKIQYSTIKKITSANILKMIIRGNILSVDNLPKNASLLTIYSMNGQLITSRKLSSSQTQIRIDIGNLNPGVYNVQINGPSIINKRFVK